jgi:hypothetical protein
MKSQLPEHQTHKSIMVEPAMKKYLRAALIIAALAPFPALSQTMTAGHLLETFDEGGPSRQRAEIFISGLYAGIQVANLASVEVGNRRIYCISEKFELTANQSVDILRAFLQDHPKDEEMSAGDVFLRALKQNFPCGNGR